MSSRQGAPKEYKFLVLGSKMAQAVTDDNFQVSSLKVQAMLVLDLG